MDDKEQNPIESGDVTRFSALEKEIIRLKSNAKRQSSKYHKLKKWTIFQLFFFILFFIMLGIYGAIQWPSGTAINYTTPVIVRDTIHIKDTLKVDLALEHYNFESLVQIPVPENGVLFSVQIGAFTSINLADYKLNLVSLLQYSFEDINQYTVGLFDDYNLAEEFRQEIIKMGFNDAFIIATKKGQRIGLQEALAIQIK